MHVTAVTPRYFQPNLKTKRVWVPELKKFVTVKATARAFKTLSKNGAYKTLAAAGLVNATRKKFRGTLEKADTENTWQIVWSDAPEPKPGARVSKNRPPVPMQVLGFYLNELREARLAPVVDFKGRKPKTDLGEN